MKKIIKLTESDLQNIIGRILSEQQKENINPNNLKFGDGGKHNPQERVAVKQLQQKLMDLGYLKTKSMVPTGYFGNMTKSALDRYNGITTKTDDIKKTKKLKTNKPYNCIAVSKEECDKISSSSDTIISSGSETACARYMRKCLSQYDSELSGNAWTVLNNLKYRGIATEKYNMFQNEINWNELWKSLKDSKVTSKSCVCHKPDHADPHCKSKIPETIMNIYPSKTGFNISNLELGDIVGMYYSPSTNKGQAFCQRLRFDKNGNIVKTVPFEFNTHVGFVVAIKNGVPIILHNIGNEKGEGLHHATPATKLLSKNGTMITWVAKDNEIKKALSSKK